MLRVSTLPAVLGQLTEPKAVHPDLPGGAPKGKVRGAVLMNRHGAALGSSGFQEGSAGPSAHTLGAIVSNVWTEFAGGIAPAAAATAHASGNSYAPGDSPSSTASDSDPSTATTAGSDSRGGWAPGSEGALEVLLLELEHGQVAVAGLCGGAYLLCAYADTEMPAGLLKAKLGSVAAFLAESLGQLHVPAE